ncbi:MAG: glycosyltransferase family 4 protein [Candidatus Accumulibacter sp.]|uniref:Glycosyltransferase family 4 protein n=1 Tax=Candidatus Accumulibacter proximus TaxID=2954385 RepID=A0A935UFB3_9PROT|nr:glycosyltransferase family 4 protein [Candidatus Accumulibacter proximus]
MIETVIRVGLVGPLPPPFGGMANQTRQLADLLANSGVKVRQVQVNAPYRPLWIGRVPVLRALFRLIPYLFTLWRVAGQCDVIHIMANSGWSWHLFAAPAVWIARFRNVPAVVNYRGGEAETFLARSSRLVRCTMGRVAVLAVPSGFLKEVFARFGIGADVVPNIVNIGRFRNDEAVEEAMRKPRRRLLVARNLEKIYDNETAIRAFAIVHSRYPEATLTIAGSGPEGEALRQLSEDLGLASSVLFAGRLEPSAMAELYRSVDVAINPSLVDNMPNSVLEALASGVPVVSTNVGGVPYMVRDGHTALLVPPRSPQAMAEAIARVIEEGELSRRLVDNGLQEVARYTWESVWPRWAEVYQRAITQPQRLPQGVR